ncbi:MAG: glycosyltransferase family 4 protein [Proteobacteria bacterium]|nr:glycosyltransferase family 4 protein [Pseudomonadota bacterium]
MALFQIAGELEVRLLFCCEFYYPSVGGVQEVVRQLAERMVLRGHKVTVATTRLANRTFSELNGVRIEEFSVVGNAVKGMRGEIERYREFVLNTDADALLIKAAQQWTFDALWPILHQVRARKIFIPCGFSRFYQSSYAEYFQQLPAVLKLFDHLIFYATRYRDIEYARVHGIRHFSVLPNGASELEFGVPRDPHFRLRHSIPEESFVFLTVGSLTGMKGHLEIAKAFVKLDTGGRPATLILNGNIPAPPLVVYDVDYTDPVPAEVHYKEIGTSELMRCFNDFASIVRLRRKKMSQRAIYIMGIASHFKETLSMRGLSAVVEQSIKVIVQKLNIPVSITKYIPLRFSSPIRYWVKKGNDQFPLKQVLLIDLPRLELIQAFKNADLFVFASNIEYSPLVLYESAAAGTPFLSVPVGNAAEIAKWTGCGIVAPANVDRNGFTRTNPGNLAEEMRRAMDSPELLAELGCTGHKRWQEQFTWASVVIQYEKILAGKVL